MANGMCGKVSWGSGKDSLTHNKRGPGRAGWEGSWWKTTSVCRGRQGRNMERTQLLDIPGPLDTTHPETADLGTYIL